MRRADTVARALPTPKRAERHAEVLRTGSTQVYNFID